MHTSSLIRQDGLISALDTTSSSRLKDRAWYGDLCWDQPISPSQRCRMHIFLPIITTKNFNHFLVFDWSILTSSSCRDYKQTLSNLSVWQAQLRHLCTKCCRSTNITDFLPSIAWTISFCTHRRVPSLLWCLRSADCWGSYKLLTLR